MVKVIPFLYSMCLLPSRIFRFTEVMDFLQNFNFNRCCFQTKVTKKAELVYPIQRLRCVDPATTSHAKLTAPSFVENAF